MKKLVPKGTQIQKFNVIVEPREICCYVSPIELHKVNEVEE